jgi:hypothetical protein
MVQVISMTTVKIPRQKGKINGKVVSKGKYVEYHLREWLRHNLGVITDRDLSELSSAIANLLIRVVGSGNEVKLSVVVKYNGVLTIGGVKRSYFHFDLHVYVGDKRINVYTFVKKRPEIFVDNSVDYFANGDFAGIADFVVNHNSVMPRFDMPNDFADIANYVTEYVKAYGKIKPRRVSDYVVTVNFAKFIELLDMFHIAFLSQETTKLIGTKFTFLAYKYLKESGYFAYVNAINHGGIE